MRVLYHRVINVICHPEPRLAGFTGFVSRRDNILEKDIVVKYPCSLYFY